MHGAPGSSMGKRRRLKLALLCGGRSGEHEVSLVSAACVHRALDPKRYDVYPIIISHRGEWRLAQAPEVTGPMKSGRRDPVVRLGGGMRPRLHVDGRSHPIEPDVFFPVMHGPYGEDGTIQGLLEMCGAPYVGAGVLASAVGMDKIAMKAVFEQAGLNVSPYIGFTSERWRNERIRIEEQILERLDLPCFIKPANSGSSVGITKVKKIEHLARAITEAFRYDRRVVAERAIIGREIECSVIGNARPEASLPGEVRPHREFYDYWDKYIGGRTQLIVPAKLPVETVEQIRSAAIRAYQAVDCEGMARVDFFLEEHGVCGHGKIYVNEINTIPGFTDISMFSKMWASSGLSYPKLLDRLVDLAFDRHRRRSKLSTVWKQGAKLVRS